ncbi:DUF29 domain-containing protein [Paraburkholderia fungorum]|uniref:DUF29 domain-containing protein n=1 Tax=Paraburkholderia fungorum TaxID=134537 RepID=UPI0038B838D3
MTDYHADFALWAREQAARLRAGAAELDRENIAEEMEALARALHGELDKSMARLLQSLLQWALLESDRRPAWYVTIQEERNMIPRLLADAPSLRQNWAETLTQAWRRAEDDARETRPHAHADTVDLPVHQRADPRYRFLAGSPGLPHDPAHQTR